MDASYSSGRPVLDLLATLSDRGRGHVERLDSWDELAGWVEASGVAVDDLAGSDSDLDGVRRLREALYRVVVARAGGATPGDEDQRLVNAAAHGSRIPRLTAGGEVRWSGGLDGVLGDLARDGLDLITSEDLHLLRQCAAPDCTRLFVDRSRAGQRRWCGMKRCGDRAKAAAYRRRRRARESPDVALGGDDPSS